MLVRLEKSEAVKLPVSVKVTVPEALNTREVEGTTVKDAVLVDERLLLTVHVRDPVGVIAELMVRL